MADNDNGVNGLGWFLAGLGIGAVVGVLYAPKAGKETRDDLAASARDAKERAAVLAQQGRERAAQLAVLHAHALAIEDQERRAVLAHQATHFSRLERVDESRSVHRARGPLRQYGKTAGAVIALGDAAGRVQQAVAHRFPALVPGNVLHQQE